MVVIAKPLFPLGKTVCTPGVVELVQAGAFNPVDLLSRHHIGDWGDCGAEDAAANDQALKDGTRIFSVYQIGPDVKLWVITEADRSVTTILLPNEY